MANNNKYKRREWKPKVSVYCKNMLNKKILSTQGMNYALKGNNFNHAPGKSFHSSFNMRNCLQLQKRKQQYNK
jgi:hypothetical protein